MYAQLALILVTDRIAAQHRQSAAERLASQTHRGGPAPVTREFRIRRPVQGVALR